MSLKLFLGMLPMGTVLLDVVELVQKVIKLAKAALALNDVLQAFHLPLY